MSETRIAIIGIDALRSYSLTTMLRSDSDVDVDSYFSFRDFKVSTRHYDGYICTPELIIKNLSFFAARKKFTLSAFQSHDFAEGDIIGEDDFKQLNLSDNLADIKTTLTEFINDVGERTSTGSLSEREIMVLREVAKGRSNKEIATQLYISVNTVLTHRKNISKKLGIRSSSGLSLYAVLNGLL